MTDEQLTYLIVAGIAVFYFFFMMKHKLDCDKADGVLMQRKVARRLKRLGKEYHVFNRMTYNSERGKTTIDHVVTSPYGIFVINDCNYVGKLYGSATSQHWTKEIMGMQQDENNPIRENMRTIKELLTLSSNTPNRALVSVVALQPRAKVFIYAGDEHRLVSYRKLAKTLKGFNRNMLTPEQISAFEEDMHGQWVKAPSNSWEIRQSAHREVVANEERHNFGRCPICGGELVRRTNNHGLFFGCSNFPECNFNTK